MTHSLGRRHGQVAEGCVGRELGRQASYRPTRLTPDNEEKGRLGGGGPTEGKRDTGAVSITRDLGFSVPKRRLQFYRMECRFYGRKFTRGRLRRRSSWNRHGRDWRKQGGATAPTPYRVCGTKFPHFSNDFSGGEPFLGTERGDEANKK